MTFSPQMTNTATLWTSTRNAYGDYVQSSSTAVVCWFREIDGLERKKHGEEYMSDAMIWFPYDTTVTEGQFVSCEGTLYQVEKINRARSPYRSGIQFIKCDLKISLQAIS